MTIRSWSASGIVCLSLAIGSAVGHSKDGSPQSTSAASEAISGKRSDQAGSSAPVSQADDEAALSELPTAGTEAGEVRYFTASKIPFCWCPPGSFLMGSPADERSRRDDETPISVTLTEGFWIDLTTCGHRSRARGNGAPRPLHSPYVQHSLWLKFLNL